ncbi:MAG: diphthine synthase, partial [Nanoarchaeota archaeon]
IKYLVKKGVSPELVGVGCAAISSSKAEIKSGKLKELMKHRFKQYPQCLIIPSKKLHFVEEEALELRKI